MILFNLEAKPKGREAIYPRGNYHATYWEVEIDEKKYTKEAASQLLALLEELVDKLDSALDTRKHYGPPIPDELLPVWELMYKTQIKKQIELFNDLGLGK